MKLYGLSLSHVLVAGIIGLILSFTLIVILSQPYIQSQSDNHRLPDLFTNKADITFPDQPSNI